MPPRLAAICIHPAPYRDPTFEQIVGRGKVDFTALMIDPIDRGHSEWNWPAPTYPCIPLGDGIRLGSSRRVHPKLLALLRREKFDVLMIPGYSRPTAMLAIAYAKATGTPFILEADSVHYPHPMPPRKPLAEKFVQGIYRAAAGFRVPGAASRDYFRSYGVADDRIAEGMYCLDAEASRAEIVAARPSRSAWRAAHEIADDAFIFLHIGNMIPMRRQELACRAIEQLDAGGKAVLVLIGSGAEREKLVQLAATIPHRAVRVLDPIPFGKLAAVYAACDAYVHPGFEPYSTALEIGAFGGLKLVSTTSVGYVEDLKRFGTPPRLSALEDVAALRENFAAAMAADDSSAKSIQRSSLQRTPAWAAEQLEQLTRAVADRH